MVKCREAAGRALIAAVAGRVVGRSDFTHNPHLCGVLPTTIAFAKTIGSYGSYSQVSTDITNTSLGYPCGKKPSLCCTDAYKMDTFCCLAKNLGAEVANKFCDVAC